MTAVEWFGLIILEQGGDYVISVFEQAKEMEKQQIIDAWEDVGTDGVTTAEEYYENTFKNTKNDIKRTI